MKSNGSPSYVFGLACSILRMRTSKTDVRKMIVVMAGKKRVSGAVDCEATIFQ